MKFGRHQPLAALTGEVSGNSLIEFALGLPLLLTAGLWGVELTNQAITNQKISQLAIELADNASRVGLFSGQASVQLRESDLNDVLQSTRGRGSGLKLTENGRVILSSLERINNTQRIHWQRCIGRKSGVGYDSSYGTTDSSDGTSTAAADAGTLAPDGMGTVPKVNAPNNSGVMFVEINYLYTPLVGNGWFASPQRITYVSSFIVRDNRDFSRIYNPENAARSTCNLYNS